MDCANPSHSPVEKVMVAPSLSRTRLVLLSEAVQIGLLGQQDCVLQLSSIIAVRHYD